MWWWLRWKDEPESPSLPRSDMCKTKKPEGTFRGPTKAEADDAPLRGRPLTSESISDQARSTRTVYRYSLPRLHL